ncbi:MAG: pyridoxamine 5'-phosphate oxidase family protein [Spirochaetales bacterium]|nr:pyridoxamine 5'-phosphate oxidase family protein [Spirochaetales bacterium]
MQRKEQEITDRKELEALITEATVCRLAVTDGLEPYVVPLNFGYDEGNFYIHGAAEGKKVALLQKNPRVCLEIDIPEGLEPDKNGNPCSYGFGYRSIIARGTAELLEDPEEKKRALEIILRHYDQEVSLSFSEASMKRTRVYKIKVLEMTGKKAHA